MSLSGSSEQDARCTETPLATPVVPRRDGPDKPPIQDFSQPSIAQQATIKFSWIARAKS